MSQSLKEIITFLISILVLFLSLVFFVYHLQLADDKNQNRQNAEVYFINNYAISSGSNSSKVNATSQKENATNFELPFSIDSNILKKLTYIDIFALVLIWVSGIVSGFFARKIAERLHNFLMR